MSRGRRLASLLVASSWGHGVGITISLGVLQILLSQLFGSIFVLFVRSLLLSAAGGGRRHRRSLSSAPSGSSSLSASSPSPLIGVVPELAGALGVFVGDAIIFLEGGRLWFLGLEVAIVEVRRGRKIKVSRYLVNRGKLCSGKGISTRRIQRRGVVQCSARGARKVKHSPKKDRQ